MSRKITYEQAQAFFDALDDNEQHMGEMAALGVTLVEFGFEDDDHGVLGDMAEAFALGPRTETVK